MLQINGYYMWIIPDSLLTLPLKRHQQQMQSLPRRIKDWIAGKIATNIIESKIAEPDEESGTESDETTEFQERKGSILRNQKDHRASAVNHVCPHQRAAVRGTQCILERRHRRKAIEAIKFCSIKPNWWQWLIATSRCPLIIDKTFLWIRGYTTTFRTDQKV